MLHFSYIKTRHEFISNHSKCLNSVCSENASEFQDISVREFQFDETIEERREMPMIVEVLFFTILVTKFVLN